MTSKKMFQVTCKVQVKYDESKWQYIYFWVNDPNEIEKTITDFFSDYNASVLDYEVIKMGKKEPDF